jgi:hypothetical protein
MVLYEISSCNGIFEFNKFRVVSIEFCNILNLSAAAEEVAQAEAGLSLWPVRRSGDQAARVLQVHQLETAGGRHA